MARDRVRVARDARHHEAKTAGKSHAPKVLILWTCKQVVTIQSVELYAPDPEKPKERSEPIMKAGRAREEVQHQRSVIGQSEGCFRRGHPEG